MPSLAPSAAHPSAFLVSPSRRRITAWLSLDRFHYGLWVMPVRHTASSAFRSLCWICC